MNEWLEDEMTPRVDRLAADFTADATRLPVEHPEWFRPHDVVRVGEDDLYDTGETDEFGNPILRARNEAVILTDASMTVQRAFGANPPQFKAKGERVTILAARVPLDGFSRTAGA